MPTQESRTVPSHPHPAPGSTVGDPLNTAAIGVGLVAGIGGCWAVHTHGDRERSGTTLARSIAKPLAATALAVVLVFGSTACSDSDSDEDAVEQEAEDEADEAERHDRLATRRPHGRQIDRACHVTERSVPTRRGSPQWTAPPRSAIIEV